MFLVSSCLCGNKCRYDGSIVDPKSHPTVWDLIQKGQVVPVCPEVLGGLPVPRPPAEISGGTGSSVLEGKARVVNRAGQEVTENYCMGSKRGLVIGLQTGCNAAILKSRSPACGLGLIYDGTFSGNTIEGDGVFAALLKTYGFKVFSEENFGLTNKYGAEGGI